MPKLRILCHSMQKGDHRHADHIQASYRFVTDLFHQRPGRHRYRRSLRAQSRAGRILYVLHLRAYHRLLLLEIQRPGPLGGQEDVLCQEPADLEFDAFFTFSLSYLNFCPKIRHSKFSVINEPGTESTTCTIPPRTGTTACASAWPSPTPPSMKLECGLHGGGPLSA